MKVFFIYFLTNETKSKALFVRMGQRSYICEETRENSSRMLQSTNSINR